MEYRIACKFRYKANADRVESRMNVKIEYDWNSYQCSRT